MANSTQNLSTLEALHVVPPFGYQASKRARRDSKYPDTKIALENISPEKKYINQRLNIKMFYNE